MQSTGNCATFFVYALLVCWFIFDFQSLKDTLLIEKVGKFTFLKVKHLEYNSTTCGYKRPQPNFLRVTKNGAVRVVFCIQNEFYKKFFFAF